MSPSLGYPLWILLSIIVFCSAQVIIQPPESVTEFLNQDAVFTCETAGGSPSWIFNGTLLGGLPPDIEQDLQHTQSVTSSGSRINYLTIPARDVYNETTVQCVVFGAVLLVRSDNVMLYIQGVFDSVKKLTTTIYNSTHDNISWDPPHSLVSHDNTTYEVTIGRMQWRTPHTTLLFKRPWPAGNISAIVIPWNPVGEGTPNMLDLTNSLKNCKKLDNIILKALPRDIQTVLLKLFAMEENGYYCLPEYVTVVYTSEENTTLSVIVEDRDVVVQIQNITQRKHWSVTVIVESLQFKNISYSTFKTQNAYISDDILHCDFINGTLSTTCVVRIFLNHTLLHFLKASNQYQLKFLQPGKYRLKVFDNQLQDEAAFILDYRVKEDEKGGNSTGDTAIIAIVLGVCVVVVLVVVIAVVSTSILICIFHKAYKLKLCNSHQNNTTGHQGADDSTVSHEEDVHSSYMVLKSREEYTLRGDLRPRQSTLRSDIHQGSTDHEENQMHTPTAVENGLAGDGSSQLLQNGEEKQYDVIPGLENTTELESQKPLQEQTNKLTTASSS